MNRLVYFLILSFFVSTLPLSAQQYQLKVSDNQRYLVRQDGTPFFYMGDTAWELFHRLDREQADTYLTNRAQIGFTVIQAVVLAEHGGLQTPNPYGHKPLKDLDPAQPNEAYFEHVDYIINKAESLGLYIGLLPSWGDKVFTDTWGTGPEILTTQNAPIFGEFLGKRYKDKPIIWIIGGDRNPREGSQDVAIWRALAKGVEKGVGGGNQAMMTFHPQPVWEGSPSKWFGNDEWLDFNMHQTGHCIDRDIYRIVHEDYLRSPAKPTINGEPIYEDHPVCFDAEKKGWSYPSHIRNAAYMSVFAGAFGHTYGCHNVWQMWDSNYKPVNQPLKPWHESLELPGAVQMSYLRALIESRPVLERVPDQTLIVENISENDSLKSKVYATRGKDYLFVYTAVGASFKLRMGGISGKTVKASWYNPRSGESTFIGKFDNKGVELFSPPETGIKQDWILMVDDTAKKYEDPKLISTKPF